MTELEQVTRLMEAILENQRRVIALLEANNALSEAIKAIGE